MIYLVVDCKSLSLKELKFIIIFITVVVRCLLPDRELFNPILFLNDSFVIYVFVILV